jgi:hypothetical protein
MTPWSLGLTVKYLEHLLSDPETTEKAVTLCPSILKENAELWEKWIYLFAKHHQLKAIGAYIPVSKPTLSDIVYEMVCAPNFFLLNCRSSAIL